MLGKKRQRSMIGKLSDLLVSGSRGSLIEAVGSPRGPLDDLKAATATQSPRGPKGYNLVGVGLGIVAAMEKTEESTQVRTRYCICNPTRVLNKLGSEGGDLLDEEDLENYTYVTCYNGPNHEPCTRVYTADGREYCCSSSTGIIGDELMSTTTSESKEVINEVFPTSEFLSSCLSCGKKLKGEDIYMYRGEKAFCSTECRSRQIMMDERKERCRSVKLSSSPCSEGQIFSAGILAI